MSGDAVGDQLLSNISVRIGIVHHNGFINMVIIVDPDGVL